MNMRILRGLIIAALLAAAASPARAHEDSERAFGFRLGYGTGPGQFVAGLQMDTGEITRWLHFVPSVDAGFGDDWTTLAINGDLKFFLPLPASGAVLYGLAGPAVTIWWPDEKARPDQERDTDLGVCLGFGVRMEFAKVGWYNIETRFGIGDVPEWRLLIGILFGKR